MEWVMRSLKCCRRFKGLELIGREWYCSRGDKYGRSKLIGREWYCSRGVKYGVISRSKLIGSKLLDMSDIAAEVLNTV